MSTIRSPVSFKADPNNAPMEMDVWNVLHEPGSDKSGVVDEFEDLVQKKTVVILACSGGGARATSLCQQSLARLERHLLDLAGAQGKTLTNLFSSIDVFAGVSGGSLYLSEIATDRHVLGTYGVPEDECFCITCTQEHIPLSFARYARYKHVGNPARIAEYNSRVYLSPLNLYIAPVLGILTDQDYIRLSAATLAFNWRLKSLFYNHAYPVSTSGGLFIDWPHPYHPNNGLILKPRFFFQATCMESAQPFVFSLNYHRTSIGSTAHDTIKRDILLATHAQRNELFEDALLLEDINSSPLTMPINIAAIASATFPAFRPMPLSKYECSTSRDEMIRAKDTFSIADGGLYDNSGLYVASEVIREVFKKKRSKELTALNRNDGSVDFVILYVEAGNEKWDAERVTRYSPPPCGVEKFNPFVFGMPLRLPNLESVDIIHAINKGRGRAQFLDSIYANEGIRVLYIPISPSMLSPEEAHGVKNSACLWNQYAQIPTDLWISESDHDLIGKIVERLLASEQDYALACNTNDIVRKVRPAEALLRYLHP